MTYVTPLPLDAITDSEMLELISQARVLGVPDDLFPRIIWRAPEQAKPIIRFADEPHAGQCRSSAEGNHTRAARALCQREIFCVPSLAQSSGVGLVRATH